MVLQSVAPPEWRWVGSSSYSQAVRVGDIVYTSGVAPFDNEGRVVGVGDCEVQARQAVTNLARLLETAGSGLAQIIRQQVFVRRPEDVEVFKRVRADLYTEPYPASVLVVVTGHAHPDMLIEIACEAIVGANP
jgi:2-iminobutanoate/2-iminopropanoate deaminase